jgi:hypothetical protein
MTGIMQALIFQAGLLQEPFPDVSNRVLRGMLPLGVENNALRFAFSGF